MIDKDLEISKEPLWAIPGPIQERLQASLKDREYTRFVLGGLFSAVAISFLVLFGIAALFRGETTYAMVIFGFALATLVVYAVAWQNQRYSYTRHFLTLLMGVLCLYLYYTGGTENTGPFYYMVFPLVAIFLQGSNYGIASVLVLLVGTWVLEAGAFGFDVERYSNILLVRITAIYLMVALLSYLIEYVRVKSERELLLSIDDLNQLTYGDVSTQLANRRLMEKLLVSEANRVQRYPQDLCVLLIEPDYLRVQISRYGNRYALLVKEQLAALLRRRLRSQDVAGVWDESRFMLLLPATSLEGARTLAARLQVECEQQQLTLQGQQLGFTVSLGLATLTQTASVDDLIQSAMRNLLQARREGGNRVNAG